MSRHQEIAELRRRRPRRRFVRASIWLAIVLAGYSWVVGAFRVDDLWSERRLSNLQRFIGELRPFPLQGRDFDLGIAIDWMRQIWADKGAEALLTTLAVSVVAMWLAGVLGALVFNWPAARNMACAEPFLPSAKAPGAGVRWGWRATVAVTRWVLVFLRSMPELVWAFLLIAMLGPTPWPAILALALHNLGILGKLNAEAIEDLEPSALAALRGLGASRRQIAAFGVWPAVLNRFLLYFFYRWETCVREATVLGLLGVVSLGYWIQDARARHHYDTMLFLVLLGALLVLLGDLASMLARRYLRRAA